MPTIISVIAGATVVPGISSRKNTAATTRQVIPTISRALTSLYPDIYFELEVNKKSTRCPKVCQYPLNYEGLG